AFNDAAVGLMPSVQRNRFAANTFYGNVRDVTVSGGGTALGNRWAGNRWDDAAAWDADGDDRLDIPYRIDRLSDDLFARHPELRLYELSPATLALDALARFFPLLEPQAIAVDSAPRPLRALPGPLEFGLAERPEAGRSPPAGALLVAVLWLGLAGISLWGARRWPL
ncbi:MAG: hypothetical protein GWN32_08535, partial [Gemmatimonadetes bacterium]|nr:hypothetical protein [Gemmatimonadota bacterium]NIU52123.1 hypothetical protein [Gemmatimonadota bacterium]NIW36563.1 hypothetical protein [Gemmatimonadota bacterium]NIY43331.1 hypothetical protein [Gemmatimonadota bacterium]